MEKFNCDSDLCIYREVSSDRLFEQFDDGDCVDIRIDKSGNITFLNDDPIIDENKSGFTFFINELIEKDFLPVNCEVGIWYLCDYICDGGESLNIIGFYDGDDCDDDPTINYLIGLL